MKKNLFGKSTEKINCRKEPPLPQISNDCSLTAGKNKPNGIGLQIILMTHH